MYSRDTSICGAILLLVVVAGPVPADDARNGPGKTGEMRSIAYPVAEHVVPLRRGFKATEDLQTTERELIAQIVKQVAPASWEGGGGRGVIQYSAQGLSLLVRQTPDVHAELQTFLDGLRKVNDFEIVIETRIVTMRSSKFWDIARELPLFFSRKDGRDVATLNDAQLFSLLETLQRDRSSHITQFPKVTCANGQAITCELADYMTMFTGVTFREEDGKPTVMPVQQKEFFGVRAKTLAVASADRRHVNLQFAIEMRNLNQVPVLDTIRVTQPIRPEDLPPELRKYRKSDFLIQVQKPEFTEAKAEIVARLLDQRSLVLRVAKSPSDCTPIPSQPILAKVPYLSRLLRQPEAVEPHEILVVVTPRIVEMTGE